MFAGVYFYNFAVVGGYKGAGGNLFRMSLLCFSLLYVVQTVGYIYFYFEGNRPEWFYFREYNRLAEFALGAILTFFALAMWIEIQNVRILEIAAEIDRVRRESLAGQDLDSLTGLLNQSALAKRMEDEAGASPASWRSATWITSRTSMTVTGTWWATRSCAISGICSAPRSAMRTRRFAGGATSSSFCFTTSIRR